MWKDPENVLRGGIDYLKDDDYFRSNSDLVSKCYRVIFGLEVLLSYIPILKIEVKEKATYMDRLEALSEHIGSSLDYYSIEEIKDIRNSLAHSVRSTVVMFKDVSGSHEDLDRVIGNIFLMLDECKKFRKNSSRKKKIKIPDIKESNLF